MISEWKAKFIELTKSPVFGLAGDWYVYFNFYNSLGQIHRLPGIGPAKFKYDKETGHLVTATYCINGEDERDASEGPTRFEFHKYGQISITYYYKGNAMHRDPKNGPAITRYSTKGIILSENYIFDDLRHRLDGPACYAMA